MIKRILIYIGLALCLNACAKPQPSPVTPEVVEQALPETTQGQELVPVDIQSEQHFTKPPARFSEAALVKALEKEGIGRPSTYASIISTIQDRRYVHFVDRDVDRFAIGEQTGAVVGNHHVERERARTLGFARRPGEITARGNARSGGDRAGQAEGQCVGR